MYCRNCGNELNEHAVVCVKCGCAIDSQKPVDGQTPVKQAVKSNTNALAIVGFVLAFFMPLAGLICSILGYKRADKEFGGNCKGLALAGTIISAIILAIEVALILFWIIAFLGTVLFVTSFYELIISLLMIFSLV